MNRVENVSRFVAALAQNPNHANETAPNIVDMAEELADEVEKRSGYGIDNTYPERCRNIPVHEAASINRLRKQQKDMEESIRNHPEKHEPKRMYWNYPLSTMKWITAVICLVLAAVVLGYGFYNACRWVWNFYS